MRLLTNLGYTLAVIVLGTLALGLDLIIGGLTSTRDGFRDIGKAVKEVWL